MKTFIDNSGRTWAVTINVDSIKRVRDALGVNLLDAVDGKLIERLVADPILLCDILYVLCQPEASAQGVNDSEFGRAMAGDAIDHATTSLLEELVAFFPATRRQLLSKALTKLRALEARAIELIDRKLDDPLLEARLQQELDEAISVVNESGG
jgi:hypothetical protein